MFCRVQEFVPRESGEAAFSVDASAITFGPGALGELGAQLANLTEKRRVAVFTDRGVLATGHVDRARESLAGQGFDVVLFDAVHVEPTDASLLEAARFAQEGRFDAFVSVGGGSVIDTCKAAALYATYPADLLAYVNAPLGEARKVPGPLPPHVACPTTSGTGSECTGIAVFDVVSLGMKTGIASPRLRPARAVVDPTCTATLPANVVAASGFDVLCHAIESFTARPFTARDRPLDPTARPAGQGRNPWSDVGSLSALGLAGRYLVRAVSDAGDVEARQAMSWAATLAGIAFGNAGCHLPHAMSYGVSGLVREFRAPGYPPEEALVPHGMSVVVGAPSVFRATASTAPERHLDAASTLGADTRGATPADAGEVLANAIIDAMKKTSVPNGVGGVGYGAADLDALAERAVQQRRLTDNAPIAVDLASMKQLFASALAYW